MSTLTTLFSFEKCRTPFLVSIYVYSSLLISFLYLITPVDSFLAFHGTSSTSPMKRDFSSSKREKSVLEETSISNIFRPIYHSGDVYVGIDRDRYGENLLKLYATGSAQSRKGIRSEKNEKKRGRGGGGRNRRDGAGVGGGAGRAKGKGFKSAEDAEETIPVDITVEEIEEFSILLKEKISTLEQYNLLPDKDKKEKDGDHVYFENSVMVDLTQLEWLLGLIAHDSGIRCFGVKSPEVLRNLEEYLPEDGNWFYLSPLRSKGIKRVLGADRLNTFVFDNEEVILEMKNDIENALKEEINKPFKRVSRSRAKFLKANDQSSGQSGEINKINGDGKDYIKTAYYKPSSEVLSKFIENPKELTEKLMKIKNMVEPHISIEGLQLTNIEDALSLYSHLPRDMNSIILPYEENITEGSFFQKKDNIQLITPSIRKNLIWTINFDAFMSTLNQNRQLELEQTEEKRKDLDSNSQFIGEGLNGSFSKESNDDGNNAYNDDHDYTEQ